MSGEDLQVISVFLAREGEYLSSDPGFEQYQEVNPMKEHTDEDVAPSHDFETLPIRVRDLQTEDEDITISCLQKKREEVKPVNQHASQSSIRLLCNPSPSTNYQYVLSGLDPDAQYFFGLRFETKGGRFLFNCLAKKFESLDGPRWEHSSMEVRTRPQSGAFWQTNGLDFNKIRFSGSHSALQETEYHNVILLRRHFVYYPVVTAYEIGQEAPVRTFLPERATIFSIAWKNADEHHYDEVKFNFDE